MEQYIYLLMSDYTLQIITLGTAMLGALCGMLGSFAVLRKQSLLGDAIAHASLPGIAIVFLVLGVKNNNGLLLGALLSGLVSAVFIKGIISKTHLKSDTALGVVLSTFFGFGMLLLTYIQKSPNANQSGLEKYLFGQAATLLAEDVWLMSMITGLALFVVLLFWKEFKMVLFDVDFTKTLGFHVKFIDTLMTSFIVIAIVMGLQTVGVVLMSAMLLAPAAAARQWTHSLSKMVFLAGIFGGVSGVLGTAISASANNLSTGPVIVLIATFFVMISFVFSPTRGLLFRQIKLWKNRNDLKLMKTLLFMYNLAKDHENISHPHKILLLNNFQGYTRKSLKRLESEELIQLNKDDWALTQKGFNTAENLYTNQ